MSAVERVAVTLTCNQGKHRASLYGWPGAATAHEEIQHTYEAWSLEGIENQLAGSLSMVSKQHAKLAIGVVVIVTSVAYLMFSGATGGTMYFLTVPEVQQKLAALQGEPLRMAGKVTEDPIEWDMRTLALAFVMGDAQARLPVRYHGVKPDMFQPGVDVIVEGRIGRDGVFVASVLMTSCPSKYQEDKSPTL